MLITSAQYRNIKVNKINVRKKYAKNDFTRLTGAEAIEMEGGSNCILAKKKTMNGFDIKRYAYCLYIDFRKGIDNSYIKMSNKCNVNNCVKQEHLIATFKPTKEDIQYICDNLKTNGIEWLSNVFTVPIPLLSKFIEHIFK